MTSSAIQKIETLSKLRKVLLICGIVSSLLYVGTDIIAGTLYAAYSLSNQAVSELFAIGAPTSRLVVPLFTVYSVLLIAFVFGICKSAATAAGGNNYPVKVDRLILHASYCGGNQTIYPSEQTAEMLMILSSPELSRNMTAEQQTMIFAQIMFPPEWLEENPESLNTFIEAAPLRSVSPEMIQQQALASATWKGSCDRLANITQPTLLIVGDQDLAIPAANSVMMAQRIPNSWLVIIQGTGHGMMEQVPNEFSAIIQTFLETVN
jgi:pimeloyl-ACP methyl ester carboxylesterase